MDAKNYSDSASVRLTQSPQGKSSAMTRRDFAKQAVGAGAISVFALISLPPLAYAWMDGKLPERDDLGDAVKALIKTYSITDPYPLKFNDGLVKIHLQSLDFAVRKGLEKEHAEHFVYVLGPVFERHIKPAVQKLGKNIFLWGIFERTGCSYQLYEHINIKEGERSFPCPYKNILEYLNKEYGTYQIVWNDVCTKWCSLTWNGYAKVAGVEIKIEPGETCKVSVV
jgi:hypothetical protein